MIVRVKDKASPFSPMMCWSSPLTGCPSRTCWTAAPSLPGRTTLQCIEFCSEPNPALSKSKCLYFTGKNNTVYPEPVKLNDLSLPWVKTASHLGHELTEMCTMDQDTRIKRARFIDKSADILEMFGFAHPKQQITAVNMYAAYLYGPICGSSVD